MFEGLHRHQYMQLELKCDKEVIRGDNLSKNLSSDLVKIFS